MKNEILFNTLIKQLNIKNEINYEYDNHTNNNILVTIKERNIYKLMEKNLKNEYELLINLFNNFSEKNETLILESSNDKIIILNNNFYLYENNTWKKIPDNYIYDNEYFSLYEFNISWKKVNYLKSIII